MRKYYRYTRRKATKENIKKLFLDANGTPLSKAMAVFIGVFISVMPIWGMQAISAIASAQFFKVNKPLAVVGSYVNMTPLFPVLIYFSLKVGALILGNIEVLPALNEISLHTAKAYFWLYVLGCIPVALITASIFGAITYLVLSYKKLMVKNMQSISVK